MADAEASGAPIDQITKSVLDRTLDVEITDHLGYEQGDRARAKLALEQFRAQWKTKSPGAVAVWNRAS